MMEPVPVRCPAIEHPDLPLADPAGLVPLLARLGGDAPVTEDETFTIGTLRPDGRVDLCKQGLGAAGAVRVLPAATASPHATHLLMGTNALEDEGARAVAGALTPGHGIRTVYLGCNRIGPDGVRALADRLAGDDTVQVLWLKRNPVGDEGARALAAMLRRNTTIRTLDLVNTGVTTDGLAGLLEVLRERDRPMERLFLGGNGLDGAAAPTLCRARSSGRCTRICARPPRSTPTCTRSAACTGEPYVPAGGRGELAAGAPARGARRLARRLRGRQHRCRVRPGHRQGRSRHRGRRGAGRGPAAPRPGSGALAPAPGPGRPEHAGPASPDGAGPLHRGRSRRNGTVRPGSGHGGRAPAGQAGLRPAAERRLLRRRP